MNAGGARINIGHWIDPGSFPGGFSVVWKTGALGPQLR